MGAKEAKNDEFEHVRGTPTLTLTLTLTLMLTLALTLTLTLTPTLTRTLTLTLTLTRCASTYRVSRSASPPRTLTRTPNLNP